MFVRVKSIGHDGHRYEYLQIVRSVRDGTRVHQELVASLGRVRSRTVANVLSTGFVTGMMLVGPGLGEDL